MAISPCDSPGKKFSSSPDLSALRWAGIGLAISDNEDLRIVEIPNLRYSTGTSFTVTGNRSLRSCCSFLPFLRSVPAGANATRISDNGFGCSSLEEIEAACPFDATEVPAVGSVAKWILICSLLFFGLKRLPGPP